MTALGKMPIDQRSLDRLDTVHPDLRALVTTAAGCTQVRFRITEGARTLEKQKALVAAGASTTMRSRHVPEMNQCGVACAIDLVALVNGQVRWDWPLYAKLAAAMKEASKRLGIPVEWGGDWKTFKDGPHFQLPWAAYP